MRKIKLEKEIDLFGNKSDKLGVTKYYDDSLALLLLDKDDPSDTQMIAILSVNLENKLTDNEFYADFNNNVDENNNIFEKLDKMGIIKITNRSERSGFCNYLICKLLK